ncbi:hypothetical protein ES288_D04G075100v1 [Gossypium darwinii]|uniref:Uncharacterized protein n=1 Tax=Gossypium darwinii TaxID=34276 RepID=A0A5D2CU77_GOSDA|nr:hypothetical protein ES288_D04G075100v1 [Gossypium darwinii]
MEAAGLSLRGHPIKLERYREDEHGPRARMTRTNREMDMHGKSQSSIVLAATADNLVVCVNRIEVPNATRWSGIGYH